MYLQPVGSEDPIGLRYELCNDRNRWFITAITSKFVGMQLPDAWKRYKSAYIVAIKGKPVFTPEEMK